MPLPDFLRLWGATNETPSSQKEQQTADSIAPQPDEDDAAPRHQHHQNVPGLSIDQQLWRAYLARIKPDITPANPAFQSQLTFFHTALQQNSIESVLEAHFAEYDVLRFIQGASVSGSRTQTSRLLRAQQDRDTAAWRHLMTSHPAWVSAPGRETLAFKVTMMYFGLPVQPMLFSDNFSSAGLGSTGSLFGDNEADDGQGEDTTDFFVPEEMRPLRFLNYYHNLGHGKDNSHMNPDQAFETYYINSMPMNLRGGEGLNFATDHDSSEYGVPAMQDAASSGDVSIRGGEGGVTETEVPIWGLNGRTVATSSQGPDSFFFAVDRLLGLRSRDNTGITVSVLAHRPLERKCSVLWKSQCLLGDSRREIDFLADMSVAMDKIMDNDNETEDSIKWTICVCQISLDKHFADSETLSYKPCPETHQIASFSLAEKQVRGPLAYLFMPSNVDAGTAANHYQKWFKSLWRTLSRPDPEAVKSNAPGTSAVQEPESRLVRITAADEEATEYFLSGVGPPRQIWEWLVEAYHTRGRREFILDTLPLSANGSLIHVPGYFRGISEHVAYKSVQDIIFVAMESIPDEQDRSALQSLVIRPMKSGDDGFLDRKGVHVLCQDGIIIDPEYLDDDDSSSSKRFAMWLQSGYILHVQPRWDEYVAWMIDAEGNTLGDAVLSFDLNEPWGNVLARVQAAYTKSGLSFSSDGTVIRIDQRIVDDNYDKNRVRWDFQTVDTSENAQLWSNFVHQALTTKSMTVQLLPFQSEVLSNATPFALRDQYPDKFYWGCHDHVKDTIVLYEEKVEEVEDDDNEDVDVPNADMPLVSRTTGWEMPKLQSKSGNTPSVTPQGLPTRTHMDDFMRGKIFREWSYGQPLSIHMEGQYPEIPVNAPPLEELLKAAGPDGTVSDAVPVLSVQLLTATEQRRLQEAFFKMRSLALGRVQACPYAGCIKCFGLDKVGNDKFMEHLKQKHVGNRCPFCDDTLLDSWQPWQIQQHFLQEHVDHFSHKGDLRRDLTVPIYSKGLVHSREQQFRFCPRCGRNHTILDAKADRAQHDNLCFPGNSTDAAMNKYCVDCGEGYVPDKGLRSHQTHIKGCKATKEQLEKAAHCEDCGLPAHEFSRRYAHKHMLHCKGVGSKRVLWCPWCGVDLKLCSQGDRHTHLDTCADKPMTGKNPIDTDTGEPMDSPRDTRDIRMRATYFKPMGQQFIRIQVPKICPIRGCTTDLSLLNAEGLWRHFYGEHKESTEGMKACPICRINFQDRGWAFLDEKTRHLNDHIEKREERILGDLQVAQAKSRGDPTLQEGLQRHNKDDKVVIPSDIAAEMARLSDVVFELQKEKRDLQRRLANLPSVEEAQEKISDPITSQLGKHHAEAQASLGLVVPPRQSPRKVPSTSVVAAGPSSSSPRQNPGPASAPGKAATPQAARTAPSNQRGGGSGGGRPRRVPRDHDGTYRPDARRPSYADDDYHEGEVPEPRPDLSIDLDQGGRRKRGRDTTAMGQTEPKKVKTTASGQLAVVEEVSDSSESGQHTPESPSADEGGESSKAAQKEKPSPAAAPPTGRRSRAEKGKEKAVAF